MQVGRQNSLPQEAVRKYRFLRLTTCLIISDFAKRREMTFLSFST